MRNNLEPFGQIIGLFIGKAETTWRHKEPTAIAKRPVDAPLWLTETGFQGDEQADRQAHGGINQALHHYSAEHMAFWQQQFPELKHVFKPGCFGENISGIGLDEDNLCIGDVLTLGTARVQVTQGRVPCWKLNAHIGNERMAQKFRMTGKTGWYYRVLESGYVCVGDFINVLERPAPDWSIAKVVKARFAPDLGRDTARYLAGLVNLSEDWRNTFAQKALVSVPIDIND